MKKTTLRQAAFKLALVAFALLAPLGLRAQNSALYEEDFESMSSEADLTTAGWISYGASGCYIGITTSYSTSGTKALLISAWNGSNNSDSEVAALPVLSTPINTLQITLSYRQRTGGTVRIGYLTDADDASTFVPLQSLTSSTSGFTTTTVELGDAPSTAARIAIQQYTWYDCYIDDIVVRTLPTCKKPQNLAATLTPGDGSIATLTWTEMGTADSWVVQYGTDATFDTYDEEITDGFDDSGNPTISLELSGLTAEQTYYARVKANCGGDESEWCSTPISFTPTDAYTLSLNEGSGTSYYVPIYYSYISYSSLNTASQFIIPASDLNSIQWANIEKMTFYANTATANYGNAEFTVYAGETAATTQTSFTDWNTLTEVYTGSVSVNNNMMEITFVNPFSYTTGNLLIGIKITTAGTNPSSFTWKGVSGLTTGVSLYSGYYSTPSTQSFLPQVTIAYTPGEEPSCLPPSGLAATQDQPDQSELSWTANNGETSWDIYYKKTIDDDYTLIDGVTDNPYTLDGLDPNTHYQYHVVANCSGTDVSDPTFDFSFKTACGTVTVPQTFTFESDAANAMPDCWLRYPNVTGVYVYSGNANNGSNCMRFYSGTNRYIALPIIEIPSNGLRVNFWTRPESHTNSDCATFQVGYITGDDFSTFQMVEAYSYNDWASATYMEKTIDMTTIPSDARVAFYHTGTAGWYWFLDDITVTEVPNCMNPSGLQPVANSETTESVQLTWTPGGSESEWDIYYTDDPADVPDENTTPSETTDQNSFTLAGLTASTNYYVYVRANCGGDQSPWSQAAEFNTACDAVTTFPWSENFESRNSGNFSDPCWENEHLVSVSNRTDVFKVYTSTNGTNSTHQLQLPDMQDGNTVKLRLPEMTLPSNNYQFTIDFYRNDGSYGSYTTEGVSVFASTDGEIEGATLLAFIPRPHSTSNSTGATTIPQETAAGWYTYELPIGFSGTCYIILRGESRYGTSSYMDNLVVEQVPTCRKPKAPVCSAKTAHTATLSWTNGNTETEWEIAYMANNNFNPNDDAELANATRVDADENPYTIEDLAQSTTYYAYVRANCGGEYSSWSVAYVNFTTEWGNVTPTGLAVAANTITSDQATASWNAVAGNTEHQSYDIYWVESPDAAPVTAVPENPTAPNLISGITTTSQVISDLTPETKYRVWVRDNCGTDGYSAWSSAVTFTTASSCNTPSNLVASNVTNNSAQLSWAAYGIDDFNLQYRVSGEEWDDNNIITNVNTPYILSLPLTGNTTYQVRVQATCTLDPTADDSWSNTISFTTACDAESMPWSENFDTWTSKSVCWSFLSGQYNMGQGTPTTYSSAWTLNSDYGDYITIDGKALTMNLYSSNRYWAVTPAINITTDDAVLKVDVAMSAWSDATPNYDDNDTLAFAISTDGGNTFTNLRVLDGDDLNNLGNGYTTIYVPVAGYNGQAVRFAIYGGSISGTSPYDNRCVIDNVSVEEAPSCYPVGTLAEATDITPFSAKLSWGLIDNAQTAWRITYAQDANFIEDMHAITVNSHENYTLSGLTPETHYYVAVCAFCGAPGYGAASNIIEFTTGIACQKPTDLAYSNLQQTSVDLSWTENGVASAWMVAYMAEGDADFTEAMATENPYTLNGLTQGTNYTVKVRSNCGGDYGNSQWSDEINFQTVAACPAPTNLAVTDGSVDGHGATITWEGTNNSYTIEYAEGPLAGLATLLNEGFEGGSMPTGWTVDGNGSWSVSTGDYSGSTGAGEGTYNAKITHDNSGDATKLITPVIDLSGVTTATLSFMHIQRSWSGDVDELRVYYRTSSSASWTLLAGQEYTTEVASWTTEDNINLPNPSSTYQIAFEMTDNWGYGVGIDEVIVTAEVNPTYIWNELASGVTGNTYTINTLDPETQYVVRMKGMCGTTPSPASNIVGFETPEACPAPTNVTVNNSTITENSAEISWDGSASGYNVRYRTATYRPTYYFNDFNEPSATGWSYSAFIYGIADPITGTDGDHNYFLAMGWSTTDEETIISPELPAYSNGSVVEFYYFGYSTQNTFQVGYSSTTSDADAFTWGSPIDAPLTAYTLYSEALPAGTKYVALKATASDQYASIFIDNFGIYGVEVPDGDWTTTTASSNSTVIGGLTESTLYDVEVQAVCGSDLSAWVATTFTTLEACAAPTAFTLGTVTTEEASFSWTAGNGNTAWDVYVKAQGGDYPSTPNANVTTPEATIDNLVANTSYSVKIVPTCDDTKSLEVANAFHTLCGVIAIDADNPYFEGFESSIIPECGDTVMSGTNKWTRNTSSNHTGTGSAYSGFYGAIDIMTPTININGEHAALTFWSKESAISYYTGGSNDAGGQNIVKVSIDGGNTWTPLWNPTFSELSTTWYQVTIDLTSYVNQNIVIAFEYQGNDAHGWYIDDVKIGVSHAITASVYPTEAGTVTGAGTYIHGDNVTLTANPNEGYQFVNWTKNDEVVSTDASYIFTANADADYVANFASYYTKNIDANKWYAISSPVHNSGDNQTIVGVAYLNSGSYDLFGYTESAGTWNKPTDVLEQSKGYIYRRAVNATLSFVGTANSGPISATVTATTGTGTDTVLQGFNLIGNPYPHAISYNNDHYTLNTNGTWQVHENGIIGVAEGFMIRVSADGNVDFEDVPATKSSTSSTSLAFTVSNGEFEDVAYARFENGEGLPKIGHLNANAPMLSIPVDGRRYAIANLGYDCENFDMNFRGTGEYTITLNTQHSSLNYCHLVDRTTGADIDLLQTPSYTFSANGSDAGRFLVKLAPNAQETTTGNFAYTDGRNWTVEGDGMLQVFDVLGRRIMTKEVSSQLTIPTTQFPAAGVYILRLGEKSQKIVVK